MDGLGYILELEPAGLVNEFDGQGKRKQRRLLSFRPWALGTWLCHLTWERLGGRVQSGRIKRSVLGHLKLQCQL